jgi:hypothetical protein
MYGNYCDHKCEPCCNMYRKRNKELYYYYYTDPFVDRLLLGVSDHI